MTIVGKRGRALMKLTAIYESETGERPIYRKGSSDYHTLKYVRWLEERASQQVKMDYSFIIDVLTITAFDNCDDIWWRVDGEYAPITIFVNCNDLFFWGSVDCEPITQDNVETLRQSYKDSQNHGGLLFCCRVRKMRPQGAYYKHLVEEKLLFDACGPKREISIGNPYAQDEFA